MNTLLTLLPELQPNLEANDVSIASILWFLDRAHLERTPLTSSIVKWISCAKLGSRNRSDASHRTTHARC